MRLTIDNGRHGSYGTAAVTKFIKDFSSQADVVQLRIEASIIQHKNRNFASLPVTQVEASQLGWCRQWRPFMFLVVFQPTSLGADTLAIRPVTIHDSLEAL